MVKNERMNERVRLEELEMFLQSTLIPLTPRGEFVSDLEGKLLSDNHTHYSLSRSIKLFILAGAGIVSSLILIITGIRATENLLKMRKGLNKEQPTLI